MQKNATKGEVARAKILLEKFLTLKNPDFRTLSYKQAEDVFALSVMNVWCAWCLLSGKED